MNGDRNKRIPCSVGVLTYNSAATLRRCLESIRDFDEIVIADGGSDDDTLAMAEEYGCTVISQSNPGHPITDFSLERNRIIDAAKHDWYLYIDSDEFASPELVEEIRVVAESETPTHQIYKVRIQRVSPDGSIWYKDLRPNYQTRFFNITSGARFGKPIHERVFFDESKYTVGTIDAPWCVPLKHYKNFAEYKEKIDYRIPLMVGRRKPKTYWEYLRGTFIQPIAAVVRTFARITLIWLLIPKAKRPPLLSKLYAVYPQWVIMREMTKKYLRRRK